MSSELQSPGFKARLGPFTPALKEIAGRLSNLTFRDMCALSDMLAHRVYETVGMHEPVNPTEKDMSESITEALLSVADAVERGTCTTDVPGKKGTH